MVTSYSFIGRSGSPTTKPRNTHMLFKRVRKERVWVLDDPSLENSTTTMITSL